MPISFTLRVPTVPGEKLTSVSEPGFDPAVAKFTSVQVKQSLRTYQTFRGIQEQPTNVVVNDHDVLELEFEGGFRQWIRADQYYQDIKGQPPVSGSDVSVELTPAGGEQTRGVPDLVLAGLKILNVNPALDGAKDLAKTIVENLEGKLEMKPGLFHFYNPETLKDAKPFKDGDTEKPYLVFIHGTASSSSGGFGKLAGTEEWAAIQGNKGYDPNRILAFEHYTLSQSPIQNALCLATALPAGAEIHLVSHSRGGLVGELLCIDPLKTVLTDLTDPFLNDPDQKDNLESLKKLFAVLQAKKFNIARFVRAASPTSGTLLAGNRIDRYFTVLLNALGLVSVLDQSFTFAFAKATALELIKLKADPKSVPGLEAMMPSSPTVRLLNHPSAHAHSGSTLAVIAGDVAGGGLLERLRSFLPDLYYRTRHDLVVDTKSMLRGLVRDQSFFYWDRGPGVDHFHYFANRGTRKCLWRALTEEPAAWNDTKDTKGTFRSIDAANLAWADVHAGWLRGPAENSPVLFFLPDLMMSEVTEEDGRVAWLSVKDLIAQGPASLAIQKAPRETRLISSYFDELLKHLNAEYEVQAFPFDWRRSTMESGEALVKRIAEVGAGRSVCFLAHGMGGLVARAAIASGAVGRLVMLGTPNGGSFSVARMLAGQHRVVQLLALLRHQATAEQVASVMRTFPGLLEQLPKECLEPAWWTAFGLKSPDHKLLDDAKSVRGKLDATLFQDAMVT